MNYTSTPQPNIISPAERNPMQSDNPLGQDRLSIDLILYRRRYLPKIIIEISHPKVVGAISFFPRLARVFVFSFRYTLLDEFSSTTQRGMMGRKKEKEKT